jgi:hypothetical protein
MVKIIAVGIIMKKYLFIVISILLACGAGYAETHVPRGPVAGTWTVAGSPYLVEGNIGIRPGTLLTIEPGVEVIFQRHFKFIVRGQLLAVGTEADSITFTAVDTTHGWHGLRFYDLSTQPDSSKLVYCKISYGRSSVQNWAGEDKNGGAIYCSNSDKLLISRCLIWNNRTGDVVGADGWGGTSSTDPGDPGESVSSGCGGAIYLYQSDVFIYSNNFFYNYTGNAIGGQGGDGFTDWSTSSPQGSDGGAGGAGSAGSGGAVYFAESTPYITGNTFIENRTGDGQGGNGGDGGDINYWGGYSFAGDGNSGGEGRGGNGGAIYLAQSEAILDNNLFIQNQTGHGTGGDGGDGGQSFTSREEPPGGRPAYNGDGGDGGNGYGGNGSVVFMADELHFANNNTFSLNQVGTSTGGLGGAAFGFPGEPGIPGISVNGSGTLHYTDESSVMISNCILWNNDNPPIRGNPQITYSCIQGGYPGIGNIDADPLFASSPAGEYFLSQIAAGQYVQSPCVDTGCPDSTFISGSTRTDSLWDGNIIDMGYHYLYNSSEPALITGPATMEFITYTGGGNPEEQTIQINNSSLTSFNYEISESITWLSVTPASGGPVPPLNLTTVSVDISGLSGGIYTGDIIITASGAQGSPDTVHVTLIISEAILAVEPDSLMFFTELGMGNPIDQTFNIDNTGTGTFDFTISENIPWLSVSPMSGGPVPPTAIITASVDVSGLYPGTYEGEVTVVAHEVYGSPKNIHVILNYDYQNPTSGSLSGTLESDTYSILGDISVQSGDSLVIESGTTLLFFGDYGFDVYGYLHAAGTEGDSISFLPDTSVLYWQGIQFIDSCANSARMEYCIVTGSNSSGIWCDNSNPEFYNCTISNNSAEAGGGVYCINADVTIDNCLIFGNSASSIGGGIRCSWCDLTVSNCTISFNSASSSGGGVFFHSGEDLIISNCTISANSAASAGGIMLVSSPAIIEYCTISMNTAVNGGGGIFCNYDYPLIYQCTISDNSADQGGGIYCGSSYPSIEYCLINGNSANSGGGIYCDGHIPTIRHCTISDNSSGIYFDDSYPIVVNCIIEGSYQYGIAFYDITYSEINYGDFYNNSGGNFIGVPPPDLGILATTNINDDSCDIFYNIFENPMFVRPNLGNYNLRALSPCIDAGDPESLLDPDSTIADIGAFYFDQSRMGMGEEGDRIIPETYSLDPPYPNPFNPVTTIHFGLPVGSWVRLEVFDILGRSQGSLLQGFRDAGYHEVTFDASTQASGLYFYRIEAGDFSDVKKSIFSVRSHP